MTRNIYTSVVHVIIVLCSVSYTCSNYEGAPWPVWITLTVLGCDCEPEEEEDEEDWPADLGSEVAADGESTPVCFWLRGTEADWEIHESIGRKKNTPIITSVSANVKGYCGQIKKKVKVLLEKEIKL